MILEISFLGLLGFILFEVVFILVAEIPELKLLYLCFSFQTL